MVLEQQQNDGSEIAPAVQEASQQEKRDSIGMYVVQCCRCNKWRTIPSKEEFETIREKLSEEPWFCGGGGAANPRRSCEEAEDIRYDTSRIWVMDKPGVPRPPPATERLAVMRGDMSKMDTYYVMPNGRRARCRADVRRFLEENPGYGATMAASSFSFAAPRIVRETVSGSAMWVAERAAREELVVVDELSMSDSSASTSNGGDDNKDDSN